MKNIHVKGYAEFLNEDGVAYATAGNTTGMGAVVSPGVSPCPGVPGPAGSGDIGVSLFQAAMKPPKATDRQGSKRYRGKSRAITQLKSITKMSGKNKVDAPSSVQSFSDFVKNMK